MFECLIYEKVELKRGLLRFSFWMANAGGGIFFLMLVQAILKFEGYQGRNYIQYMYRKSLSQYLRALIIFIYIPLLGLSISALLVNYMPLSYL